MSASTAGPPAPPKQSSTLKTIGTIAIIVMIVFATAAVLAFRGSIGGGGTNTADTHATNIVNGLITVNAGYYEYYPFYVPSGAANVQIQGGFTASGGSGNDIVVMIMDSTSFINWRNGHQVNVYYNSGQLTTSNFDVSLPSGSGSYYLVYSNTFSLISQKNVNTQVNLSYKS
jgi:hypothetical protein